MTVRAQGHREGACLQLTSRVCWWPLLLLVRLVADEGVDGRGAATIVRIVKLEVSQEIYPGAGVGVGVVSSAC